MNSLLYQQVFLLLNPFPDIEPCYKPLLMNRTAFTQVIPICHSNELLLSVDLTLIPSVLQEALLNRGVFLWCLFWRAWKKKAKHKLSISTNLTVKNHRFFHYKTGVSSLWSIINLLMYNVDKSVFSHSFACTSNLHHASTQTLLNRRYSLLCCCVVRLNSIVLGVFWSPPVEEALSFAPRSCHNELIAI